VSAVAGLIGIARQSGEALVSDYAEPQFAAVNVSTSGGNILIPAVAGKRLRVVNGLVMSAGVVTVTFKSGVGGTAITGELQLTAQTGFIAPFCPVGHFQTGVGQPLVLELNDAISVDGWLTYIEV
jgi:hypothetical protein